MRVEIEASWKQLNTLIALTEGNPELEIIKNQLMTAKQLAGDSQAGEIPEEGDNAIIKRME
ncbi:hypothetical protein LJ707_11870 [Mucilaginibacter sp. UR6-1]|uniref:hypothetical protein n=1 Tax=Mucilaginibacter sp. UR6-1 TaxID=1435643 RepID=UPI001E33D741|nr:hypothetical protein [Mucilaginibacter sp. UR6-1]MCC8409627.1 hypothetical protein [Mucilaginibacter sp. UR6-1]